MKHNKPNNDLFAIILPFNDMSLSYFRAPQFKSPGFSPGVADHSETMSHISYCVTAVSRIMHMGNWAHINIIPSLPHAHTTLSVIAIYFLQLYTNKYGIYVRAAGWPDLI